MVQVWLDVPLLKALRDDAAEARDIGARQFEEGEGLQLRSSLK